MIHLLTDDFQQKNDEPVYETEQFEISKASFKRETE